MRSTKERSSARAVVVGAGVAGLLAARVLAKYYDEVLMVERELPPAGALPRSGVPQGKHTHALTARGTALLEGFFPGFGRELEARGAVMADAQRDAEWHLGPAPLARGVADLRVIACSRPLLETVLRERTLALPNVTLRAPVRARGLVVNAARDRVVALTVAEEGGPEAPLHAGLVIDTTGRASKLPSWLEAAGYPAPPEESLAVDVGYATLCCRLPAEVRGDLLATIVGGSPERPRGGVAQVIEDDWVLMSLAGFGDHAPAPTLAGMLEHARALPNPTMLRWLERAEDVGEVARYRVARAYWRHYERTRRYPAGVLAMGDSVCAFNPVYAQGMTVAAMQALTLDECLARGERGLERRFYRRAARVIAPVWQMSASGDRAILAHAQETPARATGVQAWVERVQRAGARDPEVARRFLRVVGLVDSPAALFAPALVARVLWPRRVASVSYLGADSSESARASHGSSTGACNMR